MRNFKEINKMAERKNYKKMPVANTGHLHRQGREQFTLSDFTCESFCLSTENLSQIRQISDSSLRDSQL
ncbi:MAG: hypothetical protein H6Q19_1070 [Bacteroidetes bacterium]|nr:hypothetical protein [Bacteroidota bacterium]